MKLAEALLLRADRNRSPGAAQAAHSGQRPVPGGRYGVKRSRLWLQIRGVRRGRLRLRQLRLLRRSGELVPGGSPPQPQVTRAIPRRAREPRPVMLLVQLHRSVTHPKARVPYTGVPQLESERTAQILHDRNAAMRRPSTLHPLVLKRVHERTAIQYERSSRWRYK